MSFISSLLPALIVLGILIIIHEFGHFIACRLVGVKVEKFSIGFGPEIFHWQGKETRFVLSLLPLGGFVKPAGESVSDLGEDQPPQPGDYLAASVWARIVIVCAGVVMNYLLAFVLFIAIFMMGRPVTGTTIGDFVEGYPAEQSGLLIGDTIKQVNGQEVQTWNELTDALQAAPSATIELTVERENIVESLNVNARVENVNDVFGKEVSMKRLGIMPHPEANVFEQHSFLGAVGAAWKTEVYMTVMTHKAIFYLIAGKLSMQTISGPIGIVTMTGSAAKLGLPYVLQLMAVLSVSLAVINLLPIPALDGGHLLFLIIEAIRGKQVSLKVQENATRVGFALLLGLMVFIIYHDLVKVDFFQKIMGIFQRS